MERNGMENGDSTKCNRVRTSSMAAWQRAAIQWASSSSVDVASTTEGPSEPITWSIPIKGIYNDAQEPVQGFGSSIFATPPYPLEKYSCTPDNACLPHLLQFHFHDFLNQTLQFVAKFEGVVWLRLHNHLCQNHVLLA